MSGERRAWVLNLDAEHELEAAHRYAPTQALRAIVARERRRLIGNLVAPGDVVLGEDELDADDGRAQGLVGLAWCPTPRAIARLAAAGATVPRSPGLEVLRTANTRAFAVQVRRPLARSSFAKNVAASLDEVVARLARPATLGWLVRRSFGAAGRGRRRVAAGAPSDADRAWLVASLRLGALVVEPWVEITREYTRSGWVRPGGEVVIAPPCFQATTASGAWIETAAARRGEVPRSDDLRLQESVETAGRALADAGYFGPFGIDAFRYRAGEREELNPLSEINARFTMDWTAGMGERAPERRSSERMP